MNSQFFSLGYLCQVVIICFSAYPKQVIIIIIIIITNILHVTQGRKGRLSPGLSVDDGCLLGWIPTRDGVYQLPLFIT
jgi:hypothetical protein